MFHLKLKQFGYYPKIKQLGQCEYCKKYFMSKRKLYWSKLRICYDCLFNHKYEKNV